MATRRYSVLLATVATLLAVLPACGQTGVGSSGLGWNRGGDVVTNDQAFVMIGNSTGASNERALTGSSSITVTDNGPNGTVVLSINGPLIQGSGGTGFASYTAGDILVADNTGALVKLALGANNAVLTVDTSLNPKLKWASAGAGTVTSFSSGNLAPLFTASVANATTTPALTYSLSNAAALTWFGNATGSAAAPAYNSSAIPITLGGTGQTAKTAAFDALSPLTTAGDLHTHNGTNNIRFAIGTGNQVLGANNAGNGLEYKTITAGTNISVSHGVGTITINNTAASGVTSVGASGPASILSWSGTPVTTTGTLTATAASVGAYTVMGNNTSSSAAWSAQSMVTEQTPQAVAAVPGGNTSVRTLPTSGTLTGDYFHYGNWASTNTITCNRCRITVIGTVTLSHAITVNTELPGGTASGANTLSMGGHGSGLGAGNGANLGAAASAGGGGGGYGGVGGQGGYSSAGFDRGGRGGVSYDLNHQLFGSSGGAGASNSSNASGAGGAGGGGVLIQATGNITIGANISATGGAGVAAPTTSTAGGGGGSGGGIDIRSLGTVTVNVGSVLDVTGGAGGNGNTSGAAGGGGGGGYVAIHGSTVTNNGTITLTGGAAGGGTSATAAGAGSSGTSLIESGTTWYLRQY